MEAIRTLNQNRVLWGLVNELGRASALSREDLDPMVRRLCREASGQEHTSRLTPAQANQVIASLRGLVQRNKPEAPEVPVRVPWGPRGHGPRRETTITPPEMRLIDQLYEMVGWDQPARLAFCQRQTGKPWPQTQAHADAIIEALSDMILRKYKPEDLRRRIETLRGDPRLDSWKTGFIADLHRQYAEARDPRSVMTAHKLKKLVECEEATHA